MTRWLEQRMEAQVVAIEPLTWFGFACVPMKEGFNSAMATITTQTQTTFWKTGRHLCALSQVEIRTIGSADKVILAKYVEHYSAGVAY